MSVPLFKSLHISDTDIATVTKLFGFWVALGGTFLASYIVRTVGLVTSLLVGTVVGSASHMSLAWLAGTGQGDFIPFAIAVSVEGLAYSFAQVVLITYMSSLASTEFAASQFALMTSLCALPGSLLAGASGFVIERTGFQDFFIGTSLIGIPVALLALFVWRNHPTVAQ
jgi:MFS transporter, PAT family, beta-lactamase induction signal transducer AmpG